MLTLAVAVVMVLVVVVLVTFFSRWAILLLLSSPGGIDTPAAPAASVISLLRGALQLDGGSPGQGMCHGCRGMVKQRLTASAADQVHSLCCV